MQQGRWVSYIYRYRNNVRCENAGFIKVQRMMCNKGDEARIQIGLKLYKNKACRCMVYLLYNGNKVKYLADMSFQARERDTIIKRVEVPWERPLDDVIPFNAYDGLFFVCDDGEVLIGLWHEYVIDPSAVTYDAASMQMAREAAGKQMPRREADRQEEYREADRQLTSEAPDNQRTYEAPGNQAAYEAPDKQTKEKVNRERETDTDMQESVTEKPESCEDVCRHMLESYPKLPLFADSQFLECVKIVPQDIGKLAMSNWKLGVNSFLSHGYYHYRYIMLGKVKFDKAEAYVIGVPGVFTNKEKYLANMFGFSVFIPIKKTRILTGNFGYWISEISRE